MNKTHIIIALSAFNLLVLALMLVFVSVLITKSRELETLKASQAISKAGKPVSDVCREYNKAHMAGYNTLIQNLQTTIKANWRPTKRLHSERVAVKFEINSDGTLNSMAIPSLTHDVAYDTAIQRAILASIPFKGFPKESACESVDVEFIFDYDVIRKRM